MPPMENAAMLSRLLRSSLFLSYILLLCISTIEPATMTTTSSTTFRFTNETDKRTLLAVKDLIHSDPLYVFSSWNNSLHFCNWQGVECSQWHQRVTALRLPSLKLAGSVSPHIGNLTFLRVLILHNNTFHGLIPQEIGRLYRLQYLALANNSYEGELPINLTRCSALEYINLGGNNLGGQIPIELGYLPKLLTLCLNNNQFIKTIPLSFGNLTALRQLSLRSNHLDGSIPSELGRLTNLEFLVLSGNNLSGILPSSLYNSSSIMHLSISFNQISGNLPPGFGLAVPKLELFYIGANQFSGPIPTSLANASRLAHIDISQNAFTGPIPLSLGSLENLQVLIFEANPLLGTKNPNGLSFLTSLTNCSNLQSLALDNCNLRGMLPNSIANFSTSLTWLWLDGNYISGSIPLGIESLINLVYLDLRVNMLTGSIPHSIGKLTQLQALYLGRNNLSGKIPDSIGNLTLLSHLGLGGNMLHGSIPVSLGNCKFLQALSLNKNHISGEIPKEVVGLSSLSVGLFLGRNYLTGPLPSQVGSLININELVISDNKLSGEIPSTLGDCVVLEFLWMGGNFFEGQIPSSFQQLRGIQVLDLSRNNLSGPIPRFLGEFSFLSYLNLSFNKFEGEVPNEGFFRNISGFSISGNDKICGGIRLMGLPACPPEVSEKQRRGVAHRVILAFASAVVCIVLLSACAFAIFYRVRRSKTETSSVSPLGSQYPKLSYADIFRATNGFSSTNLIGEGSSSSVYRGILDSEEQNVAVKVLHLHEKGAKKSFMAECEALRNIRHRNLVKIITTCVSIDFKGNDFKALVFEFMPNRSLERWLHPSSTDLQVSRSLNFIERLNISIDVAEAMDYLHHHCETSLVHCDLKPSNVLLCNDLTAHVGDFGLARFLAAETGKCSHTQSSSIGIRGTVGYVAPEYGMGGEASIEGDVYSYGILTLEMFTGKRPTDSMFTDNLNLHDFVNMALPNQVIQIIDPQLAMEEEDESSNMGGSSRTNIQKIQECLVSILRLGVICSAEFPRERMDIRDVLMELHVIKNVFLGIQGEKESNT